MRARHADDVGGPLSEQLLGLGREHNASGVNDGQMGLLLNSLREMGDVAVRRVHVPIVLREAMHHVFIRCRDVQIVDQPGVFQRDTDLDHLGQAQPALQVLVTAQPDAEGKVATDGGPAASENLREEA